MPRHMSSFSYDSAVQRDPRRIPRDVVRARYLLRDLVWKDLRVRYRYTVMGFVWAVIQPLALMLILTFVFVHLFRMRVPETAGAETPHFAVVILCGLVFWQFFAAGVAGATRAITDNQHLIKKVHFAREVLPLAAVAYPLVNLAIGFVLLVAVNFFFGGMPSLAWTGLLPILIIQLVFVTGLALLCSCGQVHFQDVGYMVEVLLLFGFYASPVFYPIEFVLGNQELPELVKQLYMLNPMAGLLASYRMVFFDHAFPPVSLLLWPAAVALISFLVGATLFRRHAPTFSDRL